jgi:FKBP-type peptidyl-prolyl cis-trans isomerase
MRRFLALTLLCLLASSGLGQDKLNIKLQQSGPKPGDVASYKLGYDMGSQFHQGGLDASDLKGADFLTGFMDALKGADPSVTDAEVEKAMVQLSEKVKARIEKSGKENLAKATAFLEENKKKQGVVALPSGLQYQVLKQGNGDTPKADSTVMVHYEGKLIDGTVFDSSIKSGEPATFKANQVIPGWTEALTRMKVGDKWRVFIPPNLAYGDRGAPGRIPPNSALIFEIDLLEVK